MPRVFPFTEAVPLDGANISPGRAAGLQANVNISAASAAPGPYRFDYLFPDLQSQPNALLPASQNTTAALKELGATMIEPGAGATLASNIPAAYTYFGQFVDHDIPLMAMPAVVFNDPKLAPLPLNQIPVIQNLRTPW